MVLRVTAKTTEVFDNTKKLLRELDRLDKSFVTAGVHKGAGRYTQGDSPPTVAQVALWNEFGTEGKHPSPERAYLRTAVDMERIKIEAIRDEGLNNIVAGRTSVKKVLETIGFLLLTAIQKRINTSNAWATPNAPSTARAKNRPGGALRGATPLIESGLLFRSQAFEVKVKG